jgi:hypothetical protein
MMELDRKRLLALKIKARLWWLMPVILATQKAEIRRIMVRSQPREILRKNLCQKYHHRKGWRRGSM